MDKNALELVGVIEQDRWLLNLMRLVEKLDLPDCWLAAGAVRNRYWDFRHGRPLRKPEDIDVIYFDSNNSESERDKSIEKELIAEQPDLVWSVKNQARMHLRNGHAPYSDSSDAMSYWPETATAVGVRLIRDEVEVIAPYGLDDLLEIVHRRSPKANSEIFQKRLYSKKWKEQWPKLRLIDS